MAERKEESIGRDKEEEGRKWKGRGRREEEKRRKGEKGEGGKGYVLHLDRIEHPNFCSPVHSPEISWG